MILDLSQRRDWRHIPFPDPATDARLIARKDARVNGRVFVPQYTRKAG